MKILHSDDRKGEFTVAPEHADDLWELSTLIEPDDLVRGQTTRKVKLGNSSDRAGNIAKRVVTLTVRVEKTEFQPSSTSLRISGWVVDGLEDIPAGAHHTISVEPHGKVSIQKQVWTSIQQQKLRRATEGAQPQVLLCIMDREEAHVARLKKYGYDIIMSLTGDVVKKGDEKGRESTFYQEILHSLQELDRQAPVDVIIVASPAFWKEDFKKSIKDDKIAKKIVLATVSSSDRTAFNELLKRQEVHAVLQRDRTSKEIRMVDEVMAEIGKGGKVVYGFQAVKEAAMAGALCAVLVTNDFVNKARGQKTYQELDAILQQAKGNRAEIHLIPSEHDGGRRLDGIGGIAGLTRYKITE